MEYTIQKLGKLAGISTRTLRYYDEIGILKPARINSSGYRIYGEVEVDRLQQILFYKTLGFSLDTIKEIITDPTFNKMDALREHKKHLFARRRQLDDLIANVDKTIAATEGRVTMKDSEKFQGFKEKMIEDNERKYGKEIREKYGDDVVDKSNETFKKLSKEDYDKMVELEKQIRITLKEAFQEGDPAGELAQKAAALHKEWISMSWGQYSKEAHAGLAQMYVDDERFTAYYDKEQPGTAAFLRDAIHIYTGIKKK